MATQKKQIEAVARAAKRRGIPLSECGLMKPWAREIFEAEYKRFKPRKPYQIPQEAESREGLAVRLAANRSNTRRKEKRSE